MDTNLKKKAITLGTLVTLAVAPMTGNTVKAWGGGHLNEPHLQKNIQNKWTIGITGESKDNRDYVGLTIEGHDYPAYTVSGNFRRTWVVDEESGANYRISLWDKKVKDPNHPYGYHLEGELDRKVGKIPKSFW